MMAFTWCTKSGKSRKLERIGGPGPQDDDAAAGAVTEAQQAVVDVFLVRRVEARAAGRAPNEGEGHVDQGDPRMKKGMNRGAKKK